MLVMRPRASTAVASIITRAAPDSAREPRCCKCHSVALPLIALYWHIGATTMRLAKVSWRNRIGVKRPSGIAGSIQAKECLTLPTLVGGANPFAAGPSRSAADFSPLMALEWRKARQPARLRPHGWLPPTSGLARLTAPAPSANYRD